ncbi:MAG: oligosaccharide flippase family protein [Crocinitomicaceae bacterium]|nr:oligosaccharide flippase family protein [Crocinitomicaceae bacterium]
MLKRLRKRISESDFLKSLAILMTGTLIAQIIGYLLAPIITRIYTPAEMGEFGIFYRITLLITTIATLRYELAIPLPKRDSHAFYLFRFALKTTLITAILSLLAGVVFGMYKHKTLDYYLVLLLLVAAIFSLAFYNLGTNWAIRKEKFKKLSMAKLINSASLNGSRVIFGLFNFGSFGLIISFVLSLIIGSAFFVHDFFKFNFLSKSIFSKFKTRVVRKEYKNFPLASLPHSLSDHARDLLVGIIIIEVFSETIFGSFDHTYKMLRIPVMLIGASLSQVFFNRISKYFNEGVSIMPLFKKTVTSLFLLSIIPFLVIYLFGTELFIFVFGEQWMIAGQLSEIMAPWLMINFIVTPLSTIPLVFNTQRSFFVIGLITSLLQISGFLLLPGLLLDNSHEIIVTFQIVTWSQVLMNILVLLYLYKIVAKQKLN